MVLLGSKVDDNMLKNKNIALALFVIMLGLLVVGGTFAFLTVNVSVTNGNYNDSIECFDIVYDITNEDSTSNIEGTLFQSVGPTGGLHGKVSIKIDDNCDVTGTGNLYIHVGDEVSSNLVKTVEQHCEDVNTLQSITDYETESTCTAAGNAWVTSGSALKYAIYNSSDTNVNPISVGYVGSSTIGTDIPVYADFPVNSTQLNFYVYIWLDGYLTDNSYASLPFSGYIHASVVQNEK